MTITNPIDSVRQVSLQPTTGPQLALAGAVAVTVAFVAFGQPMLLREALLPATCVVLFVLSGAVALLAWLRPIPRRQFTYWDAAGLLTLIGVCGTMAVEPGDMVRLVASADR